LSTVCRGMKQRLVCQDLGHTIRRADSRQRQRGGLDPRDADGFKAMIERAAGRQDDVVSSHILSELDMAVRRSANRTSVNCCERSDRRGVASHSPARLIEIKLVDRIDLGLSIIRSFRRKPATCAVEDHRVKVEIEETTPRSRSPRPSDARRGAPPAQRQKRPDAYTGCGHAVTQGLVT